LSSIETRPARRSLQQLGLSEFTGGWNTVAADSLLRNNESANMLNFTMDEMGALTKRLGFQLLSTAPGQITMMFWWDTKKRLIAQVGATLHYSDAPNFSTWTEFLDLGGAYYDRMAMCDFQGNLVIVHPAFGVYIWDGFTPAAGLVSGSPKGFCCAVWQNKVWVAGDYDLPTRFWASNAGRADLWTIDKDYNEAREKDNAPITAMGSGQGMDDLGRPSLMLLKKNWWGRVNDPKSGTTFGQYTTLHNDAGASGPGAVTSSPEGLLYAIHAHGIYATDGRSQPAYLSKNIENLFATNNLDFAQQHHWVAGRWRDRVVFGVTTHGHSTPNLLLEHHPAMGWIVPHSIPCTALAVYDNDGDRRLFVSDPVNGNIYSLFKGWSDNGADISAHYETPWIPLGDGYLSRLRRVRVDARGLFNLYTRGDYSTDPGRLNVYDGDLPSIWSSREHPFDDFYSHGVMKTVKFRVEETSQTAAYGRSLLSDGTQPEIGSMALYGLLLDFVRLGYA
jgi:hypothetical protein